MLRATRDASLGRKFRTALRLEKPLQIIGVINAYAALLAQEAGFRALYLSGAGVANASYGLPDLGVTTLENVLEDVRRITAVTPLPLVVDCDTGWGNVHRTVREMARAGAAVIQIEDQVASKRCGHRPNKKLVSRAAMCDRIKAAVDARPDDSPLIMARTDAAAVEGMDGAIERARAYGNAGADLIFAEALTTLRDYKLFAAAVRRPILANITEFGKTPLFHLKELRAAGVSMALYPLSAFRAMSAAASEVYDAIRRKGSQKNIVAKMQTRRELYAILNYEASERQLDARLARKNQRRNHTTRRAP